MNLGICSSLVSVDHQTISVQVYKKHCSSSQAPGCIDSDGLSVGGKHVGIK